MTEFLPYLGIAGVAAGAIRTWSVLKYKVSVIETENEKFKKDIDKKIDSNASTVTDILKIVSEITSDLRLVATNQQHTKEELHKNTQNDIENGKKFDLLRREKDDSVQKLYSHIGKSNDKQEGINNGLRTKVQELAESLARK